MRNIARVFMLAFGTIMLLVGAIIVNNWYDSWQRDRFYVSHPMLRDMDKALHERRAELLLTRVPLGSDEADAARILSSEGLNCRRWQKDRGTYSLACDLKTRPSSIPRWFIELKLDQNGKVVDGLVTPFKATAT